MLSATNFQHVEPSVMLAAGLLAQKAVERGLRVPPWVKTSLAPIEAAYFSAGGILPYVLEQLLAEASPAKS